MQNNVWPNSTVYDIVVVWRYLTMAITETPLRYPGGKSKLYNLVSDIIKKNFERGTCTYIEPFAGGAGLALKLLYKGDVGKIILNDFDPAIYSFWYACLYQTEELCDMIEQCEVTLKTWKTQREIFKSRPYGNTLEYGFSTLFLNRCNVSGVLTGGPIGGHQQAGKYLIDARFNKKTLIEKIKKVSSFSDKIEIYGNDASDFLQSDIVKDQIDSLFFNIDPPYVKKGSQLYENFFSENDHAILSNIIMQLKSKWIITYDEAEIIYDLYEDYRKSIIEMPYSAGQTKKGNELIIYSDNLVVD